MEDELLSRIECLARSDAKSSVKKGFIFGMVMGFLLGVCVTSFLILEFL